MEQLTMWKASSFWHLTATTVIHVYRGMCLCFGSVMKITTEKNAFPQKGLIKYIFLFTTCLISDHSCFLQPYCQIRISMLNNSAKPWLSFKGNVYFYINIFILYFMWMEVPSGRSHGYDKL